MTDSATEERLVTGYAGRLLVAVSVGWLAIQAGRLVLSPSLPAVKADLGISDAQAGFAFTLLWGLYALLQYPSGRLSDALSRKTLLASGLALVVVGFGALASAPNYALFLLGAAVVGAGAGLYPTAARALVSDLYTEKRGRAFGLHTASGDVGGVASAGLAALVLAVATWRWAFLPVVAVALAILVSLHLWSREAYVFERRSLDVRDTADRLLRGSRFRWLLVAYTLYAFTWQATAAFLPTFLEVGKQFDPLVAQVAFGVLFGVGAVVKPTAGTLSDRLPRRTITVGALLLGAVSLAGVVLADSPVASVAAVVAFAAGLMAFPPVMQSYLMDAFPDDSAGGDLGAMRTVYIGIGALGPTYVGTVATAADYRVAFWGLVVALLASAALVAVTT
ncbi:MFS transporter [Halobacterium litoreum]|uniref:MFS transporter n=1 Tax=Halobacterium litoreum TaxID=2039234 RepID=A0ABD5NEV2_9EURY|nr:MFS transporter [Halobacterium litoreum]UHH13283.1 MFS transporter [Halobacterium litoreum]